MTNDNHDRLSRIEAIVESNAKSIEGLTNDIAQMRRDRDSMYTLMSELTSKMMELTGKQISTYDIMRNLDDRQAQLIEIIKSLANK